MDLGRELHEFLNSNFVLYRLLRGTTAGKAAFDKYKVDSTPTILIYEPDGTLLDWHCTYTPPPENFLARIENTVKRIDTVKAIEAGYARNPKDPDFVFKMARKYEDRYGFFDEEKTPRVLELFKEFLALDPDGKSGTTDYKGKIASRTEYAEYSVGYGAWANPEMDAKGLRAFVKKYPESPLTKMAYTNSMLAFGRQGTKEDAREFFEELVAKYPQDPSFLSQYVRRIIRDKEPLDRGLELAKKVLETSWEPAYVKSLAELYLLKGEAKEAEKNYGPEYMDGWVLMAAYNMIDYADFWLKQKKFEDNALAMIDAALRLKPEYAYIQMQAAQVLITAGREARALEIFGPAYAAKFWGNPSNLSTYAGFWSRQGKNLENALVAAKRKVELEPAVAPGWAVLAQVNSKLKKFDDAMKAQEEAIKLAQGSSAGVYQKQLEAFKKAKAEAEKK